METVGQTLDLLKWSIENSNSLWSYLHLAILATVGGAWAVRGKVQGLTPFLAIAAAYALFAVVNLFVIAGNQASASVALGALKMHLQNAPNDDPLVATLGAIKVIPAWQVMLFHLFIDAVVVFAIIRIGHVRSSSGK